MAFDFSWFALKKNKLYHSSHFELKWYWSLPQRCNYTSRKVLLGVQCICEHWIKIYKCLLTLVCLCVTPMLIFSDSKIFIPFFFWFHSYHNSFCMLFVSDSCGCRRSQFSKLIREQNQQLCSVSTELIHLPIADALMQRKTIEYASILDFFDSSLRMHMIPNDNWKVCF